MSDPEAATRGKGPLTDPELLALWPGRVTGAYNKCGTCGLVTKDAKYCPYDGIELLHIGPEQRCQRCTEQLTFVDAKFCPWCAWDLSQPYMPA